MKQVEPSVLAKEIHSQESAVAVVIESDEVPAQRQDPADQKE